MIRCEQRNKKHPIDLARDDLRNCRLLCRVHRSDWRAVQGIGHSLVDHLRFISCYIGFQSNSRGGAGRGTSLVSPCRPLRRGQVARAGLSEPVSDSINISIASWNQNKLIFAGGGWPGPGLKFGHYRHSDGQLSFDNLTTESDSDDAFHE